MVVLDVQQSPGGALGQVARHGLVDEVDHLGLHRGPAQGGGRMLHDALGQAEGLGQFHAQRCSL